jgi:hypothetical protein
VTGGLLYHQPASHGENTLVNVAAEKPATECIAKSQRRNTHFQVITLRPKLPSIERIEGYFFGVIPWYKDVPVLVSPFAFSLTATPLPLLARKPSTQTLSSCIIHCLQYWTQLPTSILKLLIILKFYFPYTSVRRKLAPSNLALSPYFIHPAFATCSSLNFGP